MTNKKIFWGMLALVLTFGFVVAGCGSTPKKSLKESPVALGLTLDESLRKYMGPQEQTWDDGNASVYYLDPLHFEAFKAELDAGDEYYQTGSWSENNRDGDRDRAFARWGARPDGNFELDLCRADNSRDGYRYVKVSPGSEPKKMFFRNESDGWVRYFNNVESMRDAQPSEVFENQNADPNVYEMDVKIISGNSDMGYGMFFGAKDSENGYTILLRPYGRFDIWKWVNGQFERIRDNVGSGQVKPGYNVVNTIKVVKNNNVYDIYLNGNAIPVFTFDDIIAGNKIGYFVFPNQKDGDDPVEVFLKVKPPLPLEEPPATLGLTLDESLRTYMGSSPQTWDGENVSVYYLDPLHFEAFKAELDVGDEYAQIDTWNEKRTWEQGKTFARCAIRADGTLQLDLCKADNSVVGYRYKKVP
jgi:hypothetical protein